MSRVLLRFVVLSALASFIVPAQLLAAPIVIDFESFADGEELTAQIPGLTLTNAAIATAEISLNEEELPPASGDRVAFDNGGAMRIDFAAPVNFVAGRFNYYVPLTLEAFNSSNTSLGLAASLFLSNAVGIGDAGSTPNESLALTLSGISYVTITGDPFGGSFTVDDLTYDISQTAVPEPALLGLIGLGLAGTAATIRRRRHRCG